LSKEQSTNQKFISNYKNDIEGSRSASFFLHQRKTILTWRCPGEQTRGGGEVWSYLQ